MNEARSNPELLDSEEEAYLQEIRADEEKLNADKEYQAMLARRYRFDDRDWDEE